jgi:hypothetical protein
MKPIFLFPLVPAALVLAMLGCTKQVQVDAAQPLQQSFQTAEPEVKHAVNTAIASLKASDFPEATRALAPVVTRQNLTEPQKQAVGIALQQINQAVEANPALNTKEMYELRAKMFRAVDGGKRF